MDIEFNNMIMYLIITLLLIFGYGIWVIFDCKLEENFSIPLLGAIFVIAISYTYSMYSLSKDCKKVNCNVR